VVLGWLATGTAVREDEVPYQTACLRFEQEAFLDALGRLLALVAGSPGRSVAGPLVLVWEDFQNAGPALLAWTLRLLSRPGAPGFVLVAVFRSRRAASGEGQDLWTPLLRRAEECHLLHRLGPGETPSGAAPAPAAWDRPSDAEIWSYARTARAFGAFEDTLVLLRELERRGVEGTDLSLALGEVLLRLGQPAAASLPLTLALEGARKQKKRPQILGALTLLCELSHVENNLAEARRYWQLAYEKAGGDRGPRTGPWYGLQVLRIFLHESVLDPSWFGKDFEDLKAYYRGLGWLTTLTFLESLVPYYRFRSATVGWEAARKEADAVLARVRAGRHLFWESVLFHCQGFLHEYAGRKAEALDWFRKGIRLRQRLGDPVELIKVYNGAGYFSFTVGEYGQAARYYTESLTLLDRVRNFPEICLTLFNMTLIFYFSGDYARALGFLQTILEMMDSLGLEVLPWHRRPKLHALAGICAQRLGQVSVALDALDQARSGSHDTDAEPYVLFLDILVNGRTLGEARVLGLFDRALAATAGGPDPLRIHLLAERARYLGPVRGEADRNEAEALARTLGPGARIGRLPVRVTALISGLRASARQEAASRSLLEKIHEVNFLRNFQSQVTSGQDTEALFRRALDLVRSQFVLGAGAVWRGDGPGKTAVQSFGTFRGAGEGRFVYRFKASRSGPLWVALEAAGGGSGLGPDETRTLTMAFQHLDLVLELLEAREILRKAATRDVLTGVLSRGEILDKIEGERRRALRYPDQPERTLSLLFLDLDHFKAYNDTFGHAAGDWALQRFARLVQGQVRTLDLLGRYGGDEFLLLLPETREEGARAAAQRILGEMAAAQGFVDELRLQFGLTAVLPPERRLGCSIGIAVMDPARPEETAALVARADAALYDAKARGRGTWGQ
jgi:diguanylate cyclase (GGDEF)-like protein